MSLPLRSGSRRVGLAPLDTRLNRCDTCGGVELYRLSRLIDAERLEIQLCRHCDAGSGLVTAIDQLTDDALAE